MAIYRVFYQSMTARYGPRFIEAETEHEARRKFAGTAFSRREYPLIHVRRASLNEAIQHKEESE